ncbi:MAG: cohesin domain-containing protein [bacterium]|nr:cohesin domain-containing protein [bacterium]
MKNLKFKIFVFSILIFGFLFLPNLSDAAILYLNPASGEYRLGDTLIAEIKIDTQGEYINTIEANLNFSSDVLEIQDLSEGNSILTLWVKDPEFKNNSISFIGGVPGGYNGPDGLIGKIIFKVKPAETNNAQIVFENTSRALINDGKGTKANLTTKGVVLNILSENSENPQNEWQENLAEDNISPQPFKVEISQNPLIFDGKYFIAFSTSDKQTGIDYYEVKEGNGEWEKTSSPYILKNQNLMGTIFVRAVDKAGNYWMEKIQLGSNKTRSLLVYFGFIVLALFLILIILKSKKRSVKNS